MRRPMTNAGLMSMNVGQQGDLQLDGHFLPQYILTSCYPAVVLSCCSAVPIAVAGGRISIFVQPYSGTVACGDFLHSGACCLLRVTFCFLLCACERCLLLVTFAWSLQSINPVPQLEVPLFVKLPHLLRNVKRELQN